MASALFKNACLLTRRAVLTNGVRASSQLYVDPQKGKITSDKHDMPDTLGHTVGPERYEMLARLAGNEDPFEMKVKKRAKGTREEPTLIPSMCDKRLVGCICEEESMTVVWMQLHKGAPKRCQCGYFFKLAPMEQPDYGQ